EANPEATEGVVTTSPVFGVPSAFSTETPAEEPTTRRRGRAPAVVVTFQAPEVTAAPARSPRPKKAVAAVTTDEGDAVPAPRTRRRAGTAGAISPSELLGATGDLEATADEDEETEDTEDVTGNGPRRRRRGRRGRGRRPEGEAGSEDESAEDAGSVEGDEDEDDEDGAEDSSAAGTRRRRRRRRSGGSGVGGGQDDDDIPTVVHVREPSGGGGQSRQRTRNRDGGGIADEDGVRGISGSTRMAAKRVRRQEGRDSGRKRAPILTEAEFLARREAVDRQMVVRQKGDRTQIAVLEDGILVEHYVTKASASSYAGNVYLGRVQNVLPSMEAAFVDVGKGRNAVLYAGEVNWEGMSSGSRKIEQALKSGQEVLVQVSKDPIGHKGARLTSQISLPGRYLVYVPESSMTGISRKLPENERTRLKNILKNVVPEGAGVIIRTAAEGASEEEIGRDVRRLQAQWEVIKTKSEAGGAPKLLHAEPDLVIKVVRDVFNEDFTKLIVQGESEWDTIRDYVEFVAPDLAPRLSKFAGNGDVFAEHRIDEQLLKALDRKVYLPSGGSLVIDRTEAMVVVDVNTGKYVGKGGNLEETVTRNNLEAAEEIARQLRLRDLGGIIVIDFIDMVLESNRDLVVRRLVECLGRDRTKHQVAEVTSLGLVQMTRKRVGQGLLESFSETCEYCNGRGVKIHLDPVDRAPERERDRTPKVGPRAPKPGPQLADDETPAAEGSGGGSRSRRRRGGRGAGSATVQPESELAELLGDAVPVEDAVEQAFEVEPVPTSPEQTPSVVADALADLEVPVEDAIEQAEEVALDPDVLPDLAEQPDPSLEDVPVFDARDLVAATPAAGDAPAEEPAVPVKRRRRAASRPTGAPTP
ncbi:MAG: ribonuclease, Rne/Rng family, partial [Frankiales bacterium]|nr:ribonuclease, Rne/Rng family [Frankiales bacterium]